MARTDNSRLYYILGCYPGVDDLELRRSYHARRATFEAFPGGDRDERLEELREAYEVLADPQRRADYDEFGERSLEPGFDGEAVRQLLAWDLAEKKRRAKAALTMPVNTTVVVPTANGGPARRRWELTIDIGPRLAKGGGLLSLRIFRPVRCPRCFGNGRAGGDCKGCDGAKQVIVRKMDPCAACAGEGRKWVQIVCVKCRNKNYRVRVCRHCNGSKVVNRRRRCDPCGGRGGFWKRVEETCGRCRGNGLEPCRRCKGAGTVRSAKPLRIRVPAMLDPNGTYRYAGAGFTTEGDVPSDLFIRFNVLPRAPRR